jgi:hypothetical protein
MRHAFPKQGGALYVCIRALAFAWVLGFAAPITLFAQNDSQSSSASSQPSTFTLPDEVKYPGEPEPANGGRNKIETSLGPLKARLYGTVLLNVSFNDSVEVGQDIPLWPAPGGGTVTFPDGSTAPSGHLHDLLFTARQSIFGFEFSPAKPKEGGWNPVGIVEMDFFGTRPADNLQPQGRVFNQPRLRKAYLALEKGNLKIVAGQDDIIISPLDPVSLSHVAVPLGATAGDLWGRFPQVRLDVTGNFGETSTLFQIGILRPDFGDPRLATFGDVPAAGTSVDTTFSGFGERSAEPFYQARFAVSHPHAGRRATLGAGTHFGRERLGANRYVDSWAFAFDFNFPIVPRVILRGEGFVGSNLVPFQGGVLQGIAATPSPAPANQNVLTTIRPIGAGGGWGELTIRATQDNKNIFYLGAGTDDPHNHQLLPGTTRAKNTFAWASYFRRITNDVTLAAEWSNWQFRTVQFAGVRDVKGSSGRGNVVNFALAYRF